MHSDGTYTIAERVAKGAFVLDQYHPSWRALVDTKTLDMSRLGTCVLSHVFKALDENEFGAYMSGLDKLGVPRYTRDDVDLGFEASKPGKEEYELLTEQWKLVIKGALNGE